ncbi:uncharacterized protein LOC113273022 [Papaver somniferum]|uniref:uncharacterized protein LOC113273022 n=1 Tax=Papaver somniferum TaxID=3469 RepID=UPI000E6F486F|nr:uncharacterized protein LOC113273022 [Papaver somniferum]
MHRHLVKKIIEEPCRVEPQFNYQFDALNIRGHSPEQQIISALRIIGYDKPADAKEDVRQILREKEDRGFPGGSLDYMHWPPVRALGHSYRNFNERQMALSKDVERAFGILERKFAIICGPYRGLSPREMHKTILTCIILHNIIIQETRRRKEWTNYEDEDLEPEIQPQRGVPAKIMEND